MLEQHCKATAPGSSWQLESEGLPIAIVGDQSVALGGARIDFPHRAVASEFGVFIGHV
jgi:hypothetical protein